MTGDEEWWLRVISCFTSSASERALHRGMHSAGTPPPRPRDGPLSLGHAPPLALYAPGQLVPCHLGSNRHCRKNDEYFFLMTHHAPCSEISVFYCRTETVSNHFLHLILIVLKN